MVSHARKPVPPDNQDDGFNFYRACLQSVREIDTTPKVVRAQATLELIANSRRPCGILRSKAYEDARRQQTFLIWNI